MRATESLDVLDGAWVGGLTKRWQPPAPAAQLDPLQLVVCPCGATLAEPCRTTGGNYTVHADRVIPRRCRCGGVLPAGEHFCTAECRAEARAETYRRREQRTPTRLRRKAA